MELDETASFENTAPEKVNSERQLVKSQVNSKNLLPSFVSFFFSLFTLFVFLLVLVLYIFLSLFVPLSTPFTCKRNAKPQEGSPADVE